MGIRHYLYISDAKINAWLPQVPEAEKRTITAELGFNLVVLKGKIGTQRDAKTPPANRISKCQVLERFILSKEKVGFPNSGKTWISGTVQARVFSTRYSAVLFVSRMSAETVVLTGSSRHLIGASETVDVAKYLPSFGPHVVEMLGDMAEKKVASRAAPEAIEWAVESTVARAQDPAWVRTLRSIELATRQPLQRVAFLARRLLPPYESAQGRRYEVYSPLFVESADE